MVQITQPWIAKKWVEIPFILLPPFVSLALIALFPAAFHAAAAVDTAWWVALVLLIDVAHVYSTLYRTYFDPIAFQQQRTPLILIPLICFVGSVLVYQTSPAAFWTVMAYLAVYHFIRQQYGFMRIYARKETSPNWCRWIDTTVIYAATIYPILFWHLSSDRQFNWFVEGDFFSLAALSNLLPILKCVYGLLLGMYVGKEIWLVWKGYALNVPKTGVIVGTIVSWYMGIVYFNGDMTFTLLNVVSHGIPYMALIWLYGKKQTDAGTGSGKLMQLVFSRYGLLLFLGIVFILAYIEEGLWDITLWKEHRSVFAIFQSWASQPSHAVLSLLVPLLALPQLTHYIVDGYIWRIRKQQLKWSDATALLDTMGK